MRALEKMEEIREKTEETRQNADEARLRRLEKLRFWRRACADSSTLTTPYNLSADGNPLFFFHGDFDTGGLYVRRLAALSGQPIVAVAPQGLHDDPLPPSIEDMAAARLPEILRVRPHGPYRLGGYCNGALVAYETARLLEARGEAVEVLILLEPSSLNTRPAYVAAHRWIARLLDPTGAGSETSRRRIGSAMWAVWSLGRILKMSPSEIAGLARYIHDRRAKRRQRLRDTSHETDGERLLQEKAARLTNAHYRASAAHVPGPVDFPVVAMSTGRDGGGRVSDLYDAVSWQAVCRRFSHLRLPGHHSTCLSEGVDTLAGHLSTILAPDATAAAPVPRTAQPASD